MAVQAHLHTNLLSHRSSPFSQLLLPASVGSSLMAQGAPRNGAMLFELSTPGGCITHAGLLEFTAAEGFVALPRKVSEQLQFPLGGLHCCSLWGAFTAVLSGGAFTAVPSGGPSLLFPLGSLHCCSLWGACTAAEAPN